MDMNPPAGSQVSVDHRDIDPVIIIPATAGSTRYFGGVFLLFWLGGWAFGEMSAINKLSSGEGGAFLLFWFGAWTVGGIVAALTAYRIFRPSVPETLQLKRSQVAYDSGIPPFEINANARNKSFQNSWGALRPNRVRVELDRQLLQTLRLRETESGNRLTVDLGAQRVEIASHASEVEREWLARLLAQRYGLTQALTVRAVQDA